MNGSDSIQIGIAALDKMLGSTGVRLGSKVLIRGGPGTGKTTLILQIAKEYLKGKRRCVAYISLEQDPEKVLAYVNDQFHFGIRILDSSKKENSSSIDTESRCILIRREEVEDAVHKIFSESEYGKKADSISCVVDIGDVITDIIGFKMEKMGFSESRQASMPTLVLIDSLNSFANLVLRCLRQLSQSTSPDIRDAIQAIWDSIQDYPRHAVLIFTGEYDPLNPHSSTVTSESYFCDVDIQLTNEPVVHESPASQSEQREQAKVSFERGRVGTIPMPRKRPEKRLFCRVVKSRSGPRQARRCAYDIVDGCGLRFYETYPGDGQIMLFAENEPQRIEWRDFILRDVVQMYLYPALDYSIFERSGLERTFASLRRFLYIPEATEMYLSSFDSYWVNWCVELCQRLEVVHLLAVKLACYEKANRQEGNFLELFCTIVGKVHRACCNALVNRDELIPDKSVKEIIKDVCKKKCELYKNCKYNDLDNFRNEIIDPAYAELKLETKQCGLLNPVMREEVRLFGERRSTVIEELKSRYLICKSEKGEKIFAVPYNANISFIVYREEFLRLLRGTIASDDLRERIENTYMNIYQASEAAGLHTLGQASVRDAVKNLVIDFREKADYVPGTWEEVISLCELGSTVVGKQLKFLIETRTFDTFACTLLELVWSTGKRLKVEADYSVNDKEAVREILFRAFYMIYLMFDRGIIPRDSCLEPEEFAGHSSRADSDWLFARHWYSTLVDVLTGKSENKGKEQGLIWRPDSSVILNIMPIPVSLSWYAEQWNKHKNGEHGDDENTVFVAQHVSCWGEWYLGIMKGTENEKLAVDLINNMMSSRKVCDRAFSCAALPTVDAFYRMYGDAGCFNLAERDPKLLPHKTYNDMRKLFKGARSRTDMFDYRHCMRELHSVLEYVRQVRGLKPVELISRIDASIQRIENLGGQQILVF